MQLFVNQESTCMNAQNACAHARWLPGNIFTKFVPEVVPFYTTHISKISRYVVLIRKVLSGDACLVYTLPRISPLKMFICACSCMISTVGACPSGENHVAYVWSCCLLIPEAVLQPGIAECLLALRRMVLILNAPAYSVTGCDSAFLCFRNYHGFQ